ncbi:unnamed protein product [Symbiodinium sp. KB8]|nr:unnamed protein product [Symbiodinium sp. KB8]
MEPGGAVAAASPPRPPLSAASQPSGLLAGAAGREDLLAEAAATAAAASAACAAIMPHLAASPNAAWTGGPGLSASGLCLVQSALGRSVGAADVIGSSIARRAEDGEASLAELEAGVALGEARGAAIAAWAACVAELERRCARGAVSLSPTAPVESAVRFADVAAALHAIRGLDSPGVTKDDAALARSAEAALAAAVALAVRGAPAVVASARARAKEALGLGAAPAQATAGVPKAESPSEAVASVGDVLPKHPHLADVRAAAMALAGTATAADVIRRGDSAGSPSRKRWIVNIAAAARAARGGESRAAAAQPPAAPAGPGAPRGRGTRSSDEDVEQTWSEAAAEEQSSLAAAAAARAAMAGLRADRGAADASDGIALRWGLYARILHAAEQRVPAAALESLSAEAAALPLHRLRGVGASHGPLHAAAARRIASRLSAPGGRATSGRTSRQHLSPQPPVRHSAGPDLLDLSADVLRELTLARCWPAELVEAAARAAEQASSTSSLPWWTASRLLEGLAPLSGVSAHARSGVAAAVSALEAALQQALRAVALAASDPGGVRALGPWLASWPGLEADAALPASPVPGALFRVAQRVLVAGSAEAAGVWEALGLTAQSAGAILTAASQPCAGGSRGSAAGASQGSALQAEVERAAARAGLRGRREWSVPLCRQSRLGASSPCDTPGLSVTVDLALPDRGVVVEVDGPSHFVAPQDPLLWGFNPYAGAVVMSDAERRLSMRVGPLEGVLGDVSAGDVAGRLAASLREGMPTPETELRDAALRASGWRVVSLGLPDVMEGLSGGKNGLADLVMRRVTEAEEQGRR